jgi:Response regulator receiver domain
METKKRPVILIVEDDALIRMEASSIIADGEFDVIEAANADEAIEILETRSDISIIFTDIQMPGSMDGLNSRPLSVIVGPRSLSSRPQDTFPSAKAICRKGRVSCLNPTAPPRS